MPRRGCRQSWPINTHVGNGSLRWSTFVDPIGSVAFDTGMEQPPQGPKAPGVPSYAAQEKHSAAQGS